MLQCVFLLFLGAFRKGQCEEKHGIYYVKHTLLTSRKKLCFALISDFFWSSFGSLGAHLCVQMSSGERSREVDVEARAG